MKKTRIWIALLLLVFCLFISSVRQGLFAESEEILVQSTHAMAILSDENRVLYSRNAGEEDLIIPASTTKVMTALLVIEAIESGSLDPDDVVVVGTEVENMDPGASGAHLKVGEEITVHDLLGVLMVKSACEAANVLAVATSGSIEQFVFSMNHRAMLLGMAHTTYANPHGLYDEIQRTTLPDLLTVFREAIQHPLFVELISAEEWNVPATNLSSKRHYTTHAKVVNPDDPSYCVYVIGAKTGYVTEGNAIVALCRKGDTDLLICLADDPEPQNQAYQRMYRDIKLIAEHYLDDYSYRSFLQTELPLGSIQVKDSQISAVEYYPSQEIVYYLPNEVKEDEITYQTFLKPILVAPLAEGDIVGSVTVFYGSEAIGSSTLEIREEVPAQWFVLFWRFVQPALGIIGWVLLGLLLVIACCVVFRKWMGERIIRYCRENPYLEVKDLFKFLYQSFYGPEHLALPYSEALSYMIHETNAAEADCLPQVEMLPGKYCRVHLKVSATVSVEKLCFYFLKSAQKQYFAPILLRWSLTVLQSLSKKNQIPFRHDSLKVQITDWKKNNFAPLHHSDTFREAVHPAYRVVLKKYLKKMNL